MRPYVLKQDVTAVQTSAQGPAYNLNETYEDETGTYRYMRFKAQRSAGEPVWAKYSNSTLVAKTRASAGSFMGFVGIAQANMASTEYGWVQTGGLGNVAAKASGTIGANKFIIAVANAMGVATFSGTTRPVSVVQGYSVKGNSGTSLLAGTYTINGAFFD